MNIVIPLAGRGSRFEAQGYTFPKPLIEIDGSPMIEVVVKSLEIEGRYVFICQETHYSTYHLADLFDRMVTSHSDITINTVTQGAACTVLLAESYIDNNEELIIANSDQWLSWRPQQFLQYLREESADGGIVTFHNSHPKWSYARIDEQGYVVEVAEKRPISDLATVGVYYFRSGASFVRGAKQMIAKDLRVNGEFYVAPVFNELIGAGDKVLTFPVSEMWGLGTPEDLDSFKRAKLLR